MKVTPTKRCAPALRLCPPLPAPPARPYGEALLIRSPGQWARQKSHGPMAPPRNERTILQKQQKRWLADKTERVWYPASNHRDTRLELCRGSGSSSSSSSSREGEIHESKRFGPLLASRLHFLRSIDHDCGLGWLVDAPTAPVFWSSALSCLQKSSSMSSSSQSSFARPTKTRYKQAHMVGQKKKGPWHRRARHEKRRKER